MVPFAAFNQPWVNRMNPEFLSNFFKVALLACCLGVMATAAQAQQKSMTVEELEQYIAQKKAALDQVKQNRDITNDKVRKVNQALESQQQRHAGVESEVQALCREQDELKPGTLDDCLAELTR